MGGYRQCAQTRTLPYPATRSLYTSPFNGQKETL